MRGKTLALALGALALLGSPCGGGPAGPSAAVSLDPLFVTVQPGGFVDLAVLITGATQPVQAFEFTVEGDPGILIPWQALPHAQYDDDGKLFVAPQVDLGTGRIERVVDLRHGAGAPTGSFRVATLRFFAWEKGTTTVRVVGGGLATASGQPFDTTLFSATVNVVP